MSPSDSPLVIDTLLPASAPVCDAEADAPGSHELVYVMEGELTLTLRGTSHTLRPGQSFSFASDAEYHYRNLGDRLLRFTKNMVMTGPY